MIESEEVYLVEQRGIEPLTSALRTRRSAKLSYCPTRYCILGRPRRCVNSLVVIVRSSWSVPRVSKLSGCVVRAPARNYEQLTTGNGPRINDNFSQDLASISDTVFGVPLQPGFPAWANVVTLIIIDDCTVFVIRCTSPNPKGV